ncbi:MAG: hypothetical protein KF710_12495 [Rhodocyclaceae bacterium]|nr:hypothetical protein [Rhodocyclaceae bacterium]
MKALPRLPVWQWIVLALLVAFVVDWFIQRPDARARELNAAIAAQASEHLKSYPYPFRVIRVDGKTAVMGSPRSFEVPVTRFIAAIHPGIDVMNANNPAFIAAQKDLAAAQSEAQGIVQAQPGIESVRWQIDTHWLAAHGVDVPAQ